MGVDDANASGIADTNSAKGDGANSGRDSILSRKLKKIVECDLEADVELQEALQELSIFFPENTLRTRRFLRGDVERRSLHISREFLSELDGVRQAVNEVADVFVSLTHSAQAMQRQLEATKAKTRDLIRQTSALQAEGQALAVQEATVHQFIVDYQLTVEQMTSLREGEVGDQFFSALDRAQDIHRNCKGLLQSGQHSTALEVMDQMSQFQEAALERLYRWPSLSAAPWTRQGPGRIRAGAATSWRGPCATCCAALSCSATCWTSTAPRAGQSWFAPSSTP